MRRHLIAVLDALAAGDTQRVALDLDVEIRLAHAGHLNDRDDIVTLAEDVDRRIGAAGAQSRPEPTAGPERVDCPLKFPKLFERIEQCRHYLILLSELSWTPSRQCAGANCDLSSGCWASSPAGGPGTSFRYAIFQAAPL